MMDEKKDKKDDETPAPVREVQPSKKMSKKEKKQDRKRKRDERE